MELRTVDPRGLQQWFEEGWADKSLVAFTIPRMGQGSADLYSGSEVLERALKLCYSPAL